MSTTATATATATLTDAGIRMLAAVRKVNAQVAIPAADSVDRDARFPKESIDALRQEGALGALVPAEFGGAGCSYADIVAMCTELGTGCASTAMIFAMHQIQVACIVEHATGSPYFQGLLRDVVAKGRLIASATTEAGIGGDVRSSLCAVRYDGDAITLEKDASVISYGEHVDDVLVTARKNDDSPASDQVIVHVQRPGLTLDPVGEWDTLGMRGTSSIGFKLSAKGTSDQIVPEPYSDVSSRTMLPVSHITWAAVWLGIAERAMSVARTYVRAAARKNPGTLPPGAQHLADAYARIEGIRSTLVASLAAFEVSRTDPSISASMGFAVGMNNLKLTTSREVAEVVQQAMFICGISAYRNDTPYSLGRQLRDSLSAQLMVHNDRILAHNASLLCVMKEG